MIVLGRKYKFTSLEMDQLAKKFSDLSIIRYTNRDSNEVISELKECVKTHHVNINRGSGIGNNLLSLGQL